MGDHARIRSLPSVDAILRELGPTPLARPMVIAIIRRELAAVRRQDQPDVSPEDVLSRIRMAIQASDGQRLRPVINATGVIVHTNLGRSPLSVAAAEAVGRIASRYNTLEYDLATGQRGVRSSFIEQHLALLCEAEATAVVNNCAAALVLILKTFAGRVPKNEVVISRGELVQIGGGFRVPEILEASGAVLREVGTTNQTRAEDYRKAINDRTAMILKVHQSNFYMGGFVAATSTEQLAAIAREAGVPLVEDLGSGVTFDTAALPPGVREPSPASCLAAGVDLVCFSCDKLLGGPQAGVIAGRANYVSATKRDPFFRALRVDRLVTAALEATVEQLLGGHASDVPVRRMIDVPADQLAARALAIVATLRGLPVTSGTGVSRIGGGAMPRSEIPSVTLDLNPSPFPVDAFCHRLRQGDPPVIGYVDKDRVKLDLRTVFPDEDAVLTQAIRAAFAVSST
jgi:L-seryl-tRNA(Ser) seleniumtransferase